jgi:hypothetical protein
MQPTALHWTSTFGDIICRIRGVKPPSCTMRTLFSAASTDQKCRVQCLLRNVEFNLLLTARLPSAALAAR